MFRGGDIPPLKMDLTFRGRHPVMTVGGRVELQEDIRAVVRATGVEHPGDLGQRRGAVGRRGVSRGCEVILRGGGENMGGTHLTEV